MRRIAVMVLLLAGSVLAEPPAPAVSFARHGVCNLFAIGEPVRFTATVLQPGDAFELDPTVALVNYEGKPLDCRGALTQLDGEKGLFAIDLGVRPVGYYQLRITTGEETGSTDFMVMPTIDRTAAEARETGCRFGMKLWFSGDIWWRRPLQWHAGDLMGVCASLGLQWTRTLASQKAYLSTPDLLANYPVNSVLKIECFPESCFDSETYGTFATYSKTGGGRTWNKSTKPLEGPYKEWLKALVASLPPEQRVYELWNEPWQWHDTLSVEDFAEVCKWSVEAIKAARPDAIVGPNIQGDLGDYDLAVMAAGGLDGMDMVAIHPYTAETPEVKGFRQRLRNYHDLLRLKLGRDLMLYSTEFGWSTSPEGDRSVSEADQARYVVREALMLYAEDVKTLIPHTLGQREQNPGEREDYFGFFRLTQTPKPALVAFATCARMIDGSRFVGDLWYGPGIGAMLFEKGGVHTLALWTAGEERTVEVAVADGFRQVGFMGAESTPEASGGKLRVTADGSVTYVIGVDPALAAQATPPTAPLNPDRWATRKTTVTASRFSQPPVIDGKIDDWQAIEAGHLQNPKLRDLAADWRTGWDDKYVYVAVEVTDSVLVNDRPLDHLGMADALTISLCGRPDRQVSRPAFYDIALTVAPTCAEKRPAAVLERALERHTPVAAEGDPTGIRWALAWTGSAWTVEAAIPFSLLQTTPEPGGKLAFNVVVLDRDNPRSDEWKEWWKRVELFSKKGRTCEQPYLILGP